LLSGWPRDPSQDAGKPRLDGRRHGVEVRFQAVVAGYLNDSAMLSGGWHPERVSFSLHDQDRDVHVIELVQATCSAGTAGRSKWECKAKDRHGTSRLRGSARDSRTQ
jgi:hypothetical protein